MKRQEPVLIKAVNVPLMTPTVEICNKSYSKLITEIKETQIQDQDHFNGQSSGQRIRTKNKEDM